MFYTHDGIGISFGILSVVGLLLGAGFCFDTTLFGEDKILILNLAYLAGLIGNSIIIYSVFKTKNEELNEDIESAINFIILMTLMGYGLGNLILFTLLVLYTLIVLIVRAKKYIDDTEFGWNIARFLDEKL